MRTNMLRTGIKVMAKKGSNGIYCRVVKMDNDGGSPVAYARQIDKEDELVEDGESFTIDEKNCLAFRFIEDPNPEDVPEFQVEDGNLVFPDHRPIQMGIIKAVDVIGAIRGAVLFSSARDNGNVDIYSYLPSRDSFYRLITDIQPSPKIIGETEDALYISEYRSHIENDPDPKDEEIKEVREVRDMAFIAKLTMKKGARHDLSFKFDEDKIRTLGEDSFVFTEIKPVGKDEPASKQVTYHLVDRYFDEICVDFPDAEADAITEVCVHERGYLLKNSTDLAYAMNSGEVIKLHSNDLVLLKDTDHLIDVQSSENDIILTFADENLQNLKRAIAKHTYDRGNVVTVEAA